MPLIHQAGSKKSFRWLAQTGFALTPSGPHSHENTLEAERRGQLPPSLYLFAGHMRSLASVVFIFVPSREPEQRKPKLLESEHKGSVTPFDTGGFLLDKLRLKDGVTVFDRPSYLADHTWPGTEWRERLAIYLVTHFQPPSEYLNPRCQPADCLIEPVDPQPECRWFAWVCEFRTQEPWSVLDADQWAATEGQRRALEDTANSMSALDVARLRRFLRGHLRVDDSEESPSRVARRWVRSELALEPPLNE